MASLPGEREPRRLPVLPLRDVVVFPHVAMPLLVGRAGSLGAIEAAASEGGMLFLVTQRRADTEEPSASDLHRVGVIARDRKSTRLNSSHPSISYAVFCLKKKKKTTNKNIHI